MQKKGPKEKEKILRRLTEKEILEELYSFKPRNAFSPKEPVAQKPVPKQTSRQLGPAEKPAKNKKKRTINPYLIWQGALLVIFIAVILFSIIRIIKIF